MRRAASSLNPFPHFHLILIGCALFYARALNSSFIIAALCFVFLPDRLAVRPLHASLTFTSYHRRILTFASFAPNHSFGLSRLIALILVLLFCRADRPGKFTAASKFPCQRIHPTATATATFPQSRPNPLRAILGI